MENPSDDENRGIPIVFSSIRLKLEIYKLEGEARKLDIWQAFVVQAVDEIKMSIDNEVNSARAVLQSIPFDTDRASEKYHRLRQLLTAMGNMENMRGATDTLDKLLNALASPNRSPVGSSAQLVPIPVTVVSSSEAVPVGRRAPVSPDHHQSEFATLFPIVSWPTTRQVDRSPSPDTQAALLVENLVPPTQPVVAVQSVAPQPSSSSDIRTTRLTAQSEPNTKSVAKVASADLVSSSSGLPTERSVDNLAPTQPVPGVSAKSAVQPPASSSGLPTWSSFEELSPRPNVADAAQRQQLLRNHPAVSRYGLTKTFILFEGLPGMPTRGCKSIVPLPLNKVVGIECVSFVEDPNLFWIQLPGAKKKIETFGSSIKDNFNLMGSEQLTSVEPGTYCAVPSLGSIAYYRGKIVAVKDDGQWVTVIHVDTGETLDIMRELLRALPAMYCLSPRQAIPCRLDNVKTPPQGWLEHLNRPFKDHCRAYYQHEVQAVRVSDGIEFGVNTVQLMRSYLGDQDFSRKVLVNEKMVGVIREDEQMRRYEVGQRRAYT